MDIDFKRLTVEDVIKYLDYFKCCAFRISDYSAAFKVMW